MDCLTRHAPITSKEHDFPKSGIHHSRICDRTLHVGATIIGSLCAFNPAPGQ
ncbi:MAG: hypothetical protein ACYT04_58110 [Nostoc sp.]